MPSRSTVQNLQLILLQDFGRDVDFQTATDIANGLIGYFDTLAKINHKNNND